MTFEIKRWRTSEKLIKLTAKLLCIFAILVILYTIVVLVPPIKNSIEIQNGTFNYSSSAMELQTAISAGNLLSSIVMAGVTAIYVIFTYLILDTTNKNTQQSAKAQKIAYLERRLELFYLPMENALKHLEISKIKDIVEVDKEASFKMRYKYELYYINQMSCDFKEELKKIVPFTYLATVTVNEQLKLLVMEIDSNPLLSDRINDAKVERIANGQKYVPSGKLEEFIKEGYNIDLEKKSEYIVECFNNLFQNIKSARLYINRDLEELVNI